MALSLEAPALRETLRLLFAELLEVAPGSVPLARLYVEPHLTPEQIWQQITLLTSPVLRHLRKQFRKLPAERVALIVGGGEDEEEDSFSSLSSGSREPEDSASSSGSEDEQYHEEQDDEKAAFLGSGDGEAPDFFNMQQMMQFVDEAEQTYIKEYVDGEEDATAAEIRSLVDSAAIDRVVEENVRYDDFFDDVQEEAALSEDARDLDEIGVAESIPRSRIESRDARAQALASRIERANLEDKHWALKGEVSTRDRPEGSLLETFLDFDFVAPTAPVITEEYTLRLEAIVKQRILEGSFDDVVRKREITVSRRPKVQLDVARDTRGLGEVFEQDYLEAIGASSLTQDEMTQEERVLQRMFRQLVRKLDALTNEHYTPSAPKVDDVVVQSKDVAAIHLEEAIPVGMSRGRQLAPEEISAPKRVLKGTDELTHHDRQRKRKAHKSAYAKKARAKMESMKIRAAQDPEFAARMEAAKQVAAVDNSKDVRQGKRADRKAAKAYTSSTQFFQRLQDEATMEAARIRGDKAPKRKRVASEASKHKL